MNDISHFWQECRASYAIKIDLSKIEVLFYFRLLGNKLPLGKQIIIHSLSMPGMERKKMFLKEIQEDKT